MCLNVFSSCTDLSAQNLHKEFRQEYDYFMALKALKNDDEKSAVRLLKKAFPQKMKKYGVWQPKNLLKQEILQRETKLLPFCLKIMMMRKPL